MTDKFHGIWTAVATPFDQDGQIDWQSYEQLIGRQLDANVDGLVVCGTTGEAPALSNTEKSALIEQTRKLAGPAFPIMAGSGGSSTQGSIETSKLALEAGADSLLVATPPYNKPNLSGLVAHYKAIARACSAPICLYHVPSRTAQKLSVEAIRELCQIPEIKVVKEASADLGFFSRAKIACQTSFLSGDDPTYLASLAVGAKGCISVVSNIYPKAMVELTRAFFANDHKRALTFHETLIPAIDALFCETNPCPLKAALSIKDLARNRLRLPLETVSKAHYQFIAETLSQCDRALEKVLSS